jgi:RHH-type transcriptional regulator, proline utilization regulon repressor / proline dehydrogenase / delta 1-pyrroline-5-carboxylate dehydrogenase
MPDSPTAWSTFCLGIGEEIGPELVGSPDVDLIAFTGSRQVGLSINELAARTDFRQHSVKRVIAEMGGKNAIIIDDDADLDEAVAGTDQKRVWLRRPEVLGLFAGDRAG